MGFLKRVFRRPEPTEELRTKQLGEAIANILDNLPKHFDASDREWIARNVYYLVLQLPREIGLAMIDEALSQHAVGTRENLTLKIAGSMFVMAEHFRVDYTKVLELTGLQMIIQNHLLCPAGMPNWVVPFSEALRFESWAIEECKSCGIPRYLDTNRIRIGPSCLDGGESEPAKTTTPPDPAPP